MKFVPHALSRAVSRQALTAQKNAPGLLFASGIVGMVGSTALACRATLRVHEILEEAQNDIETTKGMREDSPDKYSEKEQGKDLARIYARTGARIGKLYAPSVLIGGAAIGCLTKSHNMLNERNLALTAAYAAVDEAFEKYRARVVDKYGEDQDREFRYSSEEVEIVDEETGKVVTQTRVGPDPDGHSMYARFFDPLCSPWDRNPEYNLLFLRNQQNYWNDILKTRGHVFLNEVYESLGLPHSKAGSVVGWVVSRKNGDNYIDFGIWDSSRDRSIDFVNGREGAILLDFNVDGIIYDKLDNPEEKIGWQS